MPNLEIPRGSPDPITFCKPGSFLDRSTVGQQPPTKGVIVSRTRASFASRDRSHSAMSEYWKSTVSWTSALLAHSLFLAAH
jgi:hypothetical protein